MTEQLSCPCDFLRKMRHGSLARVLGLFPQRRGGTQASKASYSPWVSVPDELTVVSWGTWFSIAADRKWQGAGCSLVVRVRLFIRSSRQIFCWKKQNESLLKFNLAQSLSLVKKQTLHTEAFELQSIINIFYVFLPHMVIMWKLRTDNVTAIYCINMQRNRSPTLLKNSETLGWRYIPMR